MDVDGRNAAESGGCGGHVGRQGVGGHQLVEEDVLLTQVAAQVQRPFPQQGVERSALLRAQAIPPLT